MLDPYLCSHRTFMDPIKVMSPIAYLWISVPLTTMLKNALCHVHQSDNISTSDEKHSII